MSLKRLCYFCRQPVDIRRRMSLFCSERCEHRHAYVAREAPPFADLSPVRHSPAGPLHARPPRPRP